MNIKELHTIFRDYPVICTDSRNIVPDSIFFALKGENFDGNRFVKQSLDSGCAFAVSDSIDNEGIDGCIIVENVLKTLQDLAEYHRLEFDIPVLAITGTNGKTTTKELINAVLSRKYETVCTAGNLNNHIGVPLTLLNVNEKTEIVIVEMGANHSGEIATLCEIAHPEIGLITNIGKAHLEGFGSEEGVRKTKGELYDYVEKNRGVIFYNADDETLETMAENTMETTLVKYGKTVTGAKIDSDSTLLGFSTVEPELNVNTCLVGEYNLNNVLAAIAVGKYFDVPDTEIVVALAEYKPTANRSQLIKIASNTVIMDAYNANPSSMEAAISNFAKLKAENKLLILGDMLELGDNSLSEHRRITEIIKKHGLWNKGKVILIGRTFSQLNEEIAISFPTKSEAEKYLKDQNINYHLILVKGSRGIGLETLLKLVGSG
ncbi:MAG: UDP-N-acetylmuramoyl-tripeptide--D-alanyl-D-alanine ligase [Prevotellaceae bacterium]|jgi:UDP-N-acetylmuramoyl-tripeptide--D-alanyl-D-alanine ligase|nr:UDP-N-acetylmuramoyl-tripeptide--D-alanyl-D-alanine ligase [Prevotellaceae bacterium]